MTHNVKLTVTLNVETDTDMPKSEITKLARLHVTNCINDNPDVDGCKFEVEDVAEN